MKKIMTLFTGLAGVMSLCAVSAFATADDAIVTSGDMTGSNVMAIVCAVAAVAGIIYLWIIRRKR